MVTNNMSLGKQFQALRLEKGYNQKALSRLLGYSQSHLSAIENDYVPALQAERVLASLKKIPAKESETAQTAPENDYLKGLLQARQLAVQHLNRLDKLIKAAQR